MKSPSHIDIAQAMVCLKKSGKLEFILRTFNQYDKDGDGSITREEVAKGMEEMFFGALPESKIQTMVNSFMNNHDINRDGKVTKNEYLITLAEAQNVWFSC